MKLYIIRHGDPDYEHNTITPYGHEEAKALAEWFDDIPLDEIYTSPLGRAIDTASYTCKRKGLEPLILPWAEESMDYMQPVTPDVTLSYRFSTDGGVTEYVDYDDERQPTLTRLVESCDAFLAEHGYERDGAFYKLTAPNDKRIALFCHGGFGTALTAHLLGIPCSLGFPSMFMTTTSVTTFEFRDYYHNGYTRPRLIRFGEVTHLHQKGIAGDR